MQHVKTSAKSGVVPDATAENHTGTPRAAAAAYSEYGTAVLSVPMSAVGSERPLRSVVTVVRAPRTNRLKRKRPQPPMLSRMAAMVHGLTRTVASLVRRKALPAMHI
jgi:hypothetical protein